MNRLKVNDLVISTRDITLYDIFGFSDETVVIKIGTICRVTGFSSTSMEVRIPRGKYLEDPTISPVFMFNLRLGLFRRAHSISEINNR